MIPIKLTIEGLYSYQQRQVIDFSELVDAGLFGIFGAVGSGKSSILEALTYVLYGETERLNNKDKRSYNMMNLKSNRSYMEFDFINYEERIFRATREFKRNSKKFEDVKPAISVFYEKIDEQWIPLEHTNAEKIIGLSYANFKRTIIIPQGQFKEFIELGPKDRTTMMKEIFNLHQYDLQDKVATLFSKNKSELDQLIGKLSGFEDISEEQINENEKNYAIQFEKLAIEKEAVTKLNENFQRLSKIKEDLSLLATNQEKLDALVLEKPFYENLEAEVQQYESLERLFTNLLQEQVKNKQETVAKKTDLQRVNEQLKFSSEKLQSSEEILKQLALAYEQLPKTRQQESELNLILENKQFEQEIEKLIERSSNGKKTVEDKKDEESAKLLLIKQIESELESFQKNRVDASVLVEVENWFTVLQNIEETKTKQQDRISIQEKELKAIKLSLENDGVEIDKFEERIISENERLDNEIRIFENQLNDLKVQQQLALFSHSLEDGKPCPLCGANEHPTPLVGEDVTNKIDLIVHKIQESKQRKKAKEEQNLVFRTQILKLDQIEQQVVLEKKELESLENQIDSHTKLFKWTDFISSDRAAFELKKIEIKQVEQEFQKIEQQLKVERNAVDKIRLDLENFRKALEKFERDVLQKQTQIDQNKSNIVQLNYSEIIQKELIEIENQKNELIASNNELESKFSTLTNTVKELRDQVMQSKTSSEFISNRIEELAIREKEIENEISQKIEEIQFNSIDEVKQVLEKKINVQEAKSKIETFKLNLESTKKIIETFEAKLKGEKFDSEVFEQSVLQLREATEALEIFQNEVAALAIEIKRLKESFESKKELLLERDQLQKRADNLSVMRNLFNAQGFVQYVSTIYLRQLCDHANVRFHRMTRNQLSLQMNDQNEFEIVDFLNEGKTRSVKTLSGGQAFQVSLSLALALAESVQSNAKANRNFFFIDEGFGTQDQDAISVVFETLNELRKENRIVGIISHVEELKDRIPIALTVEKHVEIGSQITIS